MPDNVPKKMSKLKITLLLLIVLGLIGAYVGWYKFFRDEGIPEWITNDPDMRFKYGSIGAEHEVGLPYWIWYVIPRVFPDKFPGPGGYTSLGIQWEEGQEIPIGFTKRVIGFRAHRQYLRILPCRQLASDSRATNPLLSSPDRIMPSIWRHSSVCSSTSRRILASIRMS